MTGQRLCLNTHVMWPLPSAKGPVCGLGHTLIFSQFMHLPNLLSVWASLKQLEGTDSSLSYPNSALCSLLGVPSPHVCTQPSRFQDCVGAHRGLQQSSHTPDSISAFSVLCFYNQHWRLREPWRPSLFSVCPWHGTFRWSAELGGPLLVLMAKCARGELVFQSLSHAWLFSTPWTGTHQAHLSMTISQGLLRCMSVESVMLSNHLILCCPLLLLPSIFPSISLF